MAALQKGHEENAVKRFSRIIRLSVIVFALIAGINAVARAQVPFRGTVDMPVVSMGKDTVIYKPMGLGTIRSGIADLQKRVGEIQGDVAFLREQERDRESAPPSAAPAATWPDHHFWWVMLGVLIGYVLGMLMFHGRSGETSHGGSVTGPLIEGPLVECPGHTAPTKDGAVPVATIPALPGTSYRIEAPEPAPATPPAEPQA